MRQKPEYAEPVLHGHDHDAAIRQSRIDHPATRSCPVGTTMNPHEHGQAGLAPGSGRTNVQIEAVLVPTLLVRTVPTNKSLQARRGGLYGRMSSWLREEGLRRLPAQRTDPRPPE